MARTIKKREATGREDATWYVVDVGENRTDPDPFRVLILPMSGGEYQRLESRHGRITGGKFNPLARATALVEQLLRDRVIEVKGYAVEGKDGSTLSPKDGGELVAAIAFEDAVDGAAILDDIVGAIKSRSRLEDGAKNA